MTTTATIAGVEVTRYVQSCFKIKAGNLVVWIDPFRVGPAQVGQDLADVVFITHPHTDHLDVRALTACRREGAPIIASPAAAERLARQGIEAASLWEGESSTVQGMQVTAVPGYNGLHPRSRRFNVGFRFNLGDTTFYHAGDTDAVPEMADLGPVDVAFLPIGGSFVMDELEAARAASMGKAATVVPMHYGFATGGSPQRFARAVGDTAQVVALAPALPVSLPRPVRLLARLMGMRRRRW